MGWGVIRLVSGGLRAESAASCLDDVDDVIEVRYTGNLARALEGAEVGVATSPGYAPFIDLVAVELERTGEELLIRVVMADDWEPQRLPGLDEPPFSTGSSASVGMRNEDGIGYSVQINLQQGLVLGGRRPSNEGLLNEPILEGEPIGHEGPVAEGHVPLEHLPDLGSRFEWWAFTGAATDLGFNPNEGRLQQDTCGSEASPLAFPGQPLSKEALLRRLGRETPAESQPVVEPTPECTIGVSACAYDNGIDFSRLYDEIAAYVEAEYGVGQVSVDCDRANRDPPNHIPPGRVIICEFFTPSGAGGTAEVYPGGKHHVRGH